MSLVPRLFTESASKGINYFSVFVSYGLFFLCIRAHIFAIIANVKYERQALLVVRYVAS